jgi:hypothetical protein
VTIHTECPGGCGQQWLIPTETPYLCDLCMASSLADAVTFDAFDTSDVTITSVDFYDAPQGGEHHGGVLFNEDGTTTFIPPVEETK